MKMLQRILQWLYDFERRLQYTAPPLREWLHSSSTTYPELSFVEKALHLLETEDLQTAWDTALTTSAGYLAREEVLALRALGTHLGKSDAKTQLQCVRETLCVLEEQRKIAMGAVQKADKLYLTLGTSGGLALALLLI